MGGGSRNGLGGGRRGPSRPCRRVGGTGRGGASGGTSGLRWKEMWKKEEERRGNLSLGSRFDGWREVIERRVFFQSFDRETLPIFFARERLRFINLSQGYA